MAALLGSRKKVVIGLGHARPDPRDFLESGLVRRAQGLEGAEVPGQVARHRHPHLGDAEAVEQPRQLDPGRLAQRLDQVGGGLLREPLQLHEALGAQLEQVGELPHQSLAHELLGGLVPQPLDVQGVARGEVDDPAGELGRALEAVRADRERPALGERRAAGRAGRGHAPDRALRSRSGSSMRSTTCGMTSPALCTLTRSPSRMSLRATSSRLWRVARATVTPPISTGSIKATGVTTPVRPTLDRIERMRVTSLRGGNLKANAQRGCRAVQPRLSRASRSLSLMTMPSIS